MKVTTTQLFETTEKEFQLFIEKNNLTEYKGRDLFISHTLFFVDSNNVVKARLSSYNSNIEYYISEKNNGKILELMTNLFNSKCKIDKPHHKLASVELTGLEHL